MSRRPPSSVGRAQGS